MIENKPIELVDHNESWIQDFSDEQFLLKTIFSSDEYSMINHIGSTAVPWIKAKPIIDISIGLYELKNEKEYISRLEKIKYTFSNGSQFEDWILFDKSENNKRFHLHLLNKNNKRYKEQLVFKDALLGNLEFAKMYEKIKIHALHDYPGFYSMNKLPFVNAFCDTYWEVRNGIK